MRIKNLMTMTLAAVAIVFGVCACGSDDDEQEAALAAQVKGSYTGLEVITIVGEPEENTTTFQFAKASDNSIDMTIPQSGSEGQMVIPPLTVKNIPLSKNGNGIMGRLASYTGTVTNASGAEKAYTISDLVVIFNNASKDNATVAVTYVLKYGSMPFDMMTTFTGHLDVLEAGQR